MRRNETKCLLLVFLVLFALSLSGCDDSGSPAETYTLSGTLSRSGVDGEYAYLKLVTPGAGAGAAALYSAMSTAFSSTSATYTVSGIASGTYDGYAFIDMNGNAAATGYAPDSGDYATETPAVLSMTADRVQDIAEGVWSLLP